MADEDLNVVLTDTDTGDGETGKDTAVVKNDKSLEEQLEEMKRARDNAEARATQAEQRAHDAGGQAAHSAEEVRKSQLVTMTSAMEMLDQQKDQLTAQMSAAMAEGDFDKASKFSAEISVNVAKKLQIEQGKLLAETAPARETRARSTASDDPVERMAATMLPKSASWLRAHPEYARDPRKTQALIAAHNLAVTIGGFTDDGKTPMPDEYYTYVEKTLGVGGASSHANGDAAGADGVNVTLSEAAKPTKTRDEVQPSPAPASRGASSGRTVRLTPQQQEAAKISGLTNEQYAKNLVAEKTRTATH